MVGRVLGQRDRPGGIAACFIAIREYGFRHSVHTQGHLAGLGITVCVGGADYKLIAGGVVHSSEVCSSQRGAVGIGLVDFNPTGAFHLIVHIQVIPCGRGTGFCSCTGHKFCRRNFGATAIANMNDEVSKATITARLGVQIILACINSSMGKTSIGVGENDDITGNQVRIGGGSVCVSGYTAACLGRKVL